MTPRERFLAHMRFQPVDRPPFWEWPPWPSTLRRWQREALGDGKMPPEYAECESERWLGCGVDLWMRPRFPAETLSEDERYVTRRTERGVVERVLKGPDEMSMPEHVEFPVKCPADWDALKGRFQSGDPSRFPPDWSERCERWGREGTTVVLMGSRSPSLFGFARELLGPERVLLAFYDEPAMVHDMMETYTEFLLGLLPKVLDTAPLSGIFFWEDMSYRNGSLISPAMFRRFMSPRYKRITEVARGRGIDTIFVDSDGDCSELIPLWIDAGINGIFPLEVAGGMDVRRLRRQYGRNLLMAGGLDKRALARGPQAIDDELRAKAPLAHQGGYIPHLDHSIPHDVSYESFRYYWRRKKELLGWS